MIKNLEIEDWASKQLQEMADNEKRSLKSQMELILEMAAFTYKRKKEKQKLPLTN